ncbi:MAG: glycosyltransferase family 4 protein [Desulfobacteraceae bacterium]|jgi:glycosyltransferase involved in cell wall biosynthesis|nr:glycosyltransferase family 4 protein [Desulfobacteraceae bacterium]
MARIAIILNASWNIYNFRLPLLDRLSTLGHEIIVMAPEDEYSRKIPYKFHPIPIKSQSVNPFGDLLIFFNFFKLFKKTKPDVLLLYTIKPNVYGNFAAYLLGIKTISNIAGLGTLFIHPGFATKIAKLLYWLALKVPAKVFFQNEEDMETFKKEGLVSKNIAERIPGSGVDLYRFSSCLNAEKKNRKGKFVFLLLSRMLWDKGVGEYVEAAGSFLRIRTDVEFQLLGFLDSDNPQAISQKEMDRLTATEGVVYLGVSDHVEEFIQNADCVVLPSYYKEGLPRSLLEAAAMCKPIIATDVSGCRDVVEDGVNGFLCRPRDSRSLLEKMEKMIDLDVGERARLGNNGRKKVIKEFDQRLVIEKYVQAVSDILVCGKKNA